MLLAPQPAADEEHAPCQRMEVVRGREQLDRLADHERHRPPLVGVAPKRGDRVVQPLVRRELVVGAEARLEVAPEQLSHRRVAMSRVDRGLHARDRRTLRALRGRRG